MNDDFAHIVKECRLRNPKAQRELYDRLAPMVMGVCMRYTHSRNDAQDLVQDVFVKIFESLHRLKQPERVGAWAYKICVNRCINSLKHSHNMAYLEDVEYEPTSLPLDPFTMDEVVAAMQKLTPHNRLAFNLVEVEGYTLEEAANKIGCTQTALRSNLHRAKKQLRELLEG